MKYFVINFPGKLLECSNMHKLDKIIIAGKKLKKC